MIYLSGLAALSALALYVLYKAATFLIGAFAPPEMLARALLVKELEKYGINSATAPPFVIDATVELAVLGAVTDFSKWKYDRAELVEALRWEALVIARGVAGTLRSEPERRTWDMLNRHASTIAERRMREAS